MKLNGATFNKAQQDQLKRALENSGSTTLNKYEVTFTNIQGNSALVSHLNRIAKNTKGRLKITDRNYKVYDIIWESDNYIKLYTIKQSADTIRFETTELKSTDGSLFNPFWITINVNGFTNGTITSIADTLYVTYFNDTEIL